MTRVEIGSYLGLKLETVNRTFSRFQEQALIQVQQRSIYILNSARLERVMKRYLMKIQIRNFSFGGASGIVTNMGLIIGFDAATATKATILSGLLIVAIADNLTDSLSIHIYQESERLPPREAFLATLTNFAARLCLSLSFVCIVAVLPLGVAVAASLFWGMLLLTGLSYIVARDRRLPPVLEILKHIAVAAVVILASKTIGHIIVA